MKSPWGNWFIKMKALKKLKELERERANLFSKKHYRYVKKRLTARTVTKLWKSYQGEKEGFTFELYYRLFEQPIKGFDTFED